MPTHPTAAVGFGNAAAAYERGRPSYPDHAVAYLAAELGLGPATRVLDLAARHGQADAAPRRGRRRRGGRGAGRGDAGGPAEAVPGVPALEGTAEAIPLPDGSVDAVTVAQAFHWFDAGTALAEIHRVLRPGGGLGLIWNAADGGVEWVAVLRELVHAVRGSEPQYGRSPWRDAVASSRLFTPLTERTFDFEQELDEDGLVDRIASTSYVAALPEAERQQLIGQVRTLAAGVPRPIRLPYRTDVFSCRRT